MKEFNHSYKQLVQHKVAELGVAKKDIVFFYKEIHRVFAMLGIVDYKTLEEDRKRPYEKSKVGKFIDYEKKEDGKRGKHIDSLMLNEKGKEIVEKVLNKITDNTLSNRSKVTQICSLEHEIVAMRAGIGEIFLKSWLNGQGIDFEPQTKFDKQENQKHFYINGFKYTYHANTNNPDITQRNLVVSNSEVNNEGKHFTNNVFWFIYRKEIGGINSPVIDRGMKWKIQGLIMWCYWNWFFTGEFNWYYDLSELNVLPSAPKEKSKLELLVAELALKINRLTNENNLLKAKFAKIEQMLNINTEIQKIKISKEEVLTEIKALPNVQPLPVQKRYKTIDKKSIQAETNRTKKAEMKLAYETLEKRRLLTAKYRPAEGWKFGYDKDKRQGTIELLYRLDNRQSAVYNTRHRLLHTWTNEEGKTMKEMSNSGEKYVLPYGLDKLDYSFPYVFICEGAYDSCFLKNCLAYANWVLPHEISKVIDILRGKGFQIVHILDNFRIDNEKGGQKGLTTLLRSRKHLQQGDLIYNWSNYANCDDLNEVAVKYGVDEVPYQDIIDNCWNEAQAREKGLEYTCVSID